MTDDDARREPTVEEERALDRLVEAYARAVDRLDLAGCSELFLPDGVLRITHRDGSRPEVERRGRDAIAAALEGLRRYEVTTHLLGQRSYRVGPDGTADGEVHCLAHHVGDAGGTRTNHVMAVRYLDRYERDGERWCFAIRHLHVDWVEDRPMG